MPKSRRWPHSKDSLKEKVIAKSLKLMKEIVKLQSLPFSDWKSFRVEFGVEKDARAKCAMIRRQVGDFSGLFALRMGKTLIYYNVGSPLKDAICELFLGSIGRGPTETNWNRWQRFFAKRGGDVTICWRRENFMNVPDRLTLKSMKLLYDPEFKRFRKAKRGN